MTAHEQVIAEERKARQRQRNLEKARRVKSQKAAQRKAACEREARQASAKDRAAETRQRREQRRYEAALREVDGLTVPTRDREIAEDRVASWSKRTGGEYEVIEVLGYGFSIREVA